MFKSLICWWKGHEWPAFERRAREANGKNVYFRCVRCGEPEAAYVDKDGTVHWCG